MKESDKMKDKIIIYHGSISIIDKPTYGFGKAYNDYGLGFYATEDMELAKEWAVEEDKSGFANKYELDLSDLKETFSNLKDDEASPINPSEYIISIDGARTSMVNWLSFLFGKLNFSDQTLFRSVSIFDQYISKMTMDEASELDQQYLNLITIACLSLATKLEEINCNYISFLNEKVLNSPN